MLKCPMEKKYKDILKKSSILLVEDNVKLRKTFKEMLLIYVDFIYEASNGDDALEIFSRERPNIIITDVDMPLMNGLLLTNLIRKMNKEVPIVVVSAYNDTNLLLDFISQNLVNYLVKPVDFEQISSVLQSCAKIILEKGLIDVTLTENAIYSYSKKSLIVNDELIPLAPKEILFLELLLKNMNVLVSKETIEADVYNHEFMSASAINSLVSKLRKKIGANIITNVSTFGYMIVK